MRVDAFTVGDAANISDGLVNVIGAGWQQYTADSFPGQMKGALAVVLMLEPDDEVTDLALSATLALGAEKEIQIFSTHLNGRAGQKVAFAIPFAMDVIRDTGVKLVLYREGAQIAVTNFWLSGP